MMDLETDVKGVMAGWISGRKLWLFQGAWGFFPIFGLPVKLCIHSKLKLPATMHWGLYWIIPDGFAVPNVFFWANKCASMIGVFLSKMYCFNFFAEMIWRQIKPINTLLSSNSSHSNFISRTSLFIGVAFMKPLLIVFFVTFKTSLYSGCELEGTTFPPVSHFSIFQHPPERWGHWFLHVRATPPSLLLTSMSLCRGRLI